MPDSACPRLFILSSLSLFFLSRGLPPSRRRKIKIKRKRKRKE
jgi:hypothetical protein